MAKCYCQKKCTYDIKKKILSKTLNAGETVIHFKLLLSCQNGKLEEFYLKFSCSEL